MYKGKKYNFIVISLIFIISFVVGISAGMTKVSIEDSLNDGFENEIITETEQEEVVPEGLEVPGEDATAFERIAFAMDIYENGKGYTSQSNQIIDIIGNIQYSSTKRFRAGKLDISEEWYKMTGVASSYGRNRFVSSYSDSENVKILFIENSDYYNYTKRTYNPSHPTNIHETTVDDWYNTNKKMKINSFFTPINENTSTVKYYDSKARGRDYYTITVGVHIDALSENFLATFASNGASGLKIEYVDITFTISKTTGYLLSYEADGSVTATYVPLNVSAPVYIGIKEVFSTMNKSAEEELLSLRQQNFGF